MYLSERWKRKDDSGIIGKIRDAIKKKQVKIYTPEEIEEYAREHGLVVARSIRPHGKTKKNRKRDFDY